MNYVGSGGGVVNTVLKCHVVLVHGIYDGALFPCRNGFYVPMASLHYSIPSGRVRISIVESDTPNLCKLPKQRPVNAVSLSVKISKGSEDLVLTDSNSRTTLAWSC